MIELRFEDEAITLPFPGHKDEVVKLHAPSDDRQMLEALFQNDVNTTMHFVRVSYPPQIQPVRV